LRRSVIVDFPVELGVSNLPKNGVAVPTLGRCYSISATLVRCADA
jgi:hypothetical protein